MQVVAAQPELLVQADEARKAHQMQALQPVGGADRLFEPARRRRRGAA